LNGKLRIEFRGATFIGDAGPLILRELERAFRLTERRSALCSLSRLGKSIGHTVAGTLRQTIFGLVASYKEVNNADRWRIEPATRRALGGRARDRKPLYH